MEKLKQDIDAVALRGLFIERQCPGIASLIDLIEEKHPEKISSMSIPDPDDLIDGVTNAVVRAFGIKEQFVSHAEATAMIFGAAANKPEFHDSGLEIGPFWDPNGQRVEATPLQWLEAFSRAMPELSPAAIMKVDVTCAAFAVADRTAVPLDITNL